MNVPHCYITHTLPVLFVFLPGRCWDEYLNKGLNCLLSHTFCHLTLYNLCISFVFLFAIKNIRIKVWRTNFACFIYEKWSLTLRDDCGLRMFVDTVLRNIFGSQRENLTGESVKLHNAEFCDIYSLPHIISDQMKEVLWHKWGRREMHMGFGVGRLEGKRQQLRLKDR